MKNLKAALAETQRSMSLLAADSELLDTIERVALHCAERLSAGSTVLLAGNGGSAADAQHIAGELVSRFYYDRPGLAAIALTTDSSILTSIGNDYGFERLFSRQVNALGRPGDVFIGISTSGRSPNIIAGLDAARSGGLTTVGLTGSYVESMAPLCDFVIGVPSSVTPRIQEIHIMIAHAICETVEATCHPR